MIYHFQKKGVAGRGETTDVIICAEDTMQAYHILGEPPEYWDHVVLDPDGKPDIILERLQP